MWRPRSIPPKIEAVAAIYDAASDEARWPAVVAELTAYLGGVAGALQVRVLAPDLATTMVTCGVDEAFGKSYGEHYFRSDPTWQGAERLEAGQTVVMAEILTRDVLRRTEFHQDWARPQGFQDLQGAILLRDGARVVSFAMFGPRRRPFDETTRARLEGVVPHLARAMKVALELRELRAAEQVARVASAAGRFSSVRVERDLCVVAFISPELDDERSPLRVRSRRLIARDAAVADWIRAAVAGALGGASSEIPLRDEQGDWRILVAPSCEAPGRCAEVLWWRVERAAMRLDVLPPSLRRVAALLREGLSDKEIAGRADMSLATARTYVARVLRALGVKSRRDLMHSR